jgi:hypothetical protein
MESVGVYAFHADQPKRAGWNKPKAAISANAGYFVKKVGLGTTAPVSDIEIRRDDADSSITYHDPGNAWYTS